MRATKTFAILTAALVLASARLANAEPLYIPNAEFGQPLVTNFDTDVATNMIGWETFPQEADGGIGVFGNLPGDGEFITNCVGNQAAYLFNEGGLALFQDFGSVDSVGTSNIFLSTFEVGRCYKLRAGLIASIYFGDSPGASVEMSLYYRDGLNNMVSIISTNIVYDTSVFTTTTGFVPFELDLPPVQPGDAWAGQHIGISFSCTTFDPDLQGGFWDLGNVALSSSIYIPNADFELPLVTDYDTDVNTNMMSWKTTPSQPDGAIGVFGNLPDDGQYITNCLGNQAAYLFNEGGVALYQDYATVDSTGAQATNFSATYEAGKSYSLSAGLIGSMYFGEAPGSSIEMSLYYRDGSNNMVTVAATNIVYDPNVFTSILAFVNCRLASPTVQSSDPWAGKHIGIQFQCTTFDPDLEGGFWDLGNIELSESLTPVLASPAIMKGQFQATLESDPGVPFAILATSDLTSPAWTTLTSLTNVSGATTFFDMATNGPRRFYQAQRLPSH